MSGIYRYYNIQNGKSYIGQSSDLQHRHIEHLSSLRRGNDGCILLQRMWDKYGEDNIVYEILCFCDESELDTKEVEYIEKYNSYHNGYNCNKGGSGNRGFIHSIETKAKISKSTVGRKASRTAKENMSKAQKGRILSEAHKTALSNSWTPERKAQHSKLRSGANNPNYGRTGKDACNTVKVMCNTGEVFNTLLDAAKWCGLKTSANISSCIHGNRSCAGKHPITGVSLSWVAT